jgi:hypothetical protein
MESINHSPQLHGSKLLRVLLLGAPLRMLLLLLLLVPPRMLPLVLVLEGLVFPAKIQNSKC